MCKTSKKDNFAPNKSNARVMILSSLSVLNYKNIEQVDLNFSPKINCFIGSNGVGKTNLLDAIYYLSFCHSATTTLDAQVVRHGADSMAVQGVYDCDGGEREVISAGVIPHKRKRFNRNKKPYKRLAEHIGLIPLVMISPQDYTLVAGGSDERRKLIDTVVSQYDAIYLNSLIKYNRALQQRNALLRSDEEPDTTVMKVFEGVMAVEGERIFSKRNDFITKLVPIFQKYYSLISNDREIVSLRYTSHCMRGSLLDVIVEGRAKDRVMGYSLHGIHRDELEMTLDGYPIRREGSQGQSKSFLVALKFAQFELLKHVGREVVPLLLLDDLFDKLDAERVAQIVNLVAGDDFGQIFITDTNREHLDSILAATNRDYRLFNVHNGNVRE